MIDNHPITPPPELWGHWLDQWNNMPVPRPVCLMYVSIQAAQWGADQELEACKQYMHDQDWLAIGMSPTLRMAELHNARRPKPPSLKQQALHELADVYDRDKIDDSTYDTIRRALEALPND